MVMAKGDSLPNDDDEEQGDDDYEEEEEREFGKGGFANL